MATENQPEHYRPKGKVKDPFKGVPRFSRRTALAGMVGAGVSLMQNMFGQHNHGHNHGAPQQRPVVPEDPTKVLGGGTTALGQRSPFAQLFRTAGGTVTGSAATPHQGLFGLTTPSDLHFERNHAGVPAIDPLRHELLIHGMVDKPMVFTLADLMRMPAVSRIYFLECGGNSNWDSPANASPQFVCPLFSQSEWTGVMLSTLMREVGVSPKAKWFLAESGDAAMLTRSIPMEKAWDDAMIAYGQNGEMVRPSNGYPMRLFLPGWEGNACVKWLRRIEVSDSPFQTRQETSRYTEPLGDGKIRQFSFIQDARSLITSPSHPMVIKKGFNEIRGFAFSGRGAIKRVDVSVDSGKTWQPANILPPVMPKAYARFNFHWNWDGKETGISSRVIDETGYVQPTRKQLTDARGPAGIIYHANQITAWRVKKSGEVFFWPYFNA